MAQEEQGRQRRPRGWLLLLYKLPVWVYRLRLGWLLSRPLLGFWFLMITHRGRNTGQTYHTVVEIVRYDRVANEYIVASGYGEASDWYRNLQATSALGIQVGNRHYTVEQRFLTPDQVYLEFVDYESRHPRSARTLPRHLGLPYDRSEAQRRVVTSALRMVAFHPIVKTEKP
jgi:deazaflavin-dependent oxidoreductase (nitroreductase family)